MEVFSFGLLIYMRFCTVVLPLTCSRWGKSYFLFLILSCAVMHIGRGGQGSFNFSEYRPQESVPREEGPLRHTVIWFTLIIVFNSIPNSDSWSLTPDWQDHRDKLIGKPRTHSHGEEALEMEGARFCCWREGGPGWSCGSFQACCWAGANGDPHIHHQLLSSASITASVTSNCSDRLRVGLDGEVNVAFLAWVLLRFGNNKTNNVARLAMRACCGSTQF